MNYVIGHQIFLTKEERNTLQERSVCVTGTYVPVLVQGETTDEPAQEIFCHYYLEKGERFSLSQSPLGGWVIILPTPRVLLDRQKNGAEFFYATYQNESLLHGEVYQTLHQLVICDAIHLEKTLCTLPVQD